MKKNHFKTTIFIAWRYLFSKKKHNIINIISIISTVGIIVCTAAFIIILSAFNGLDNLIRENFNSFNPDLKVTLKEGKSFSVDSFPFENIRHIPGIIAVEEVVSDLTLINYEDRQILIYLKGVSPNYIRIRNMDQLLIDGNFLLKDKHFFMGVMGASAAAILQLNLNSPEMLHIYYPKRTKKNFINSADAFNKRYIIPSGVFASNTEYDDQYIFCDLDFCRDVMDYEGEVTSVEIITNPHVNIKQIKKKVEESLGDSFLVLDKYQQEELLFKTIKSEKLIIYFILAFILLVASFNIIGTLGMLIVEKQDDIQVFYSLGANQSFINKIFLTEGLFISFLGGIIGMAIGAIICFIQDRFHLIQYGQGDGQYIISHYPVSMAFSDFVIVFITILTISLLASWIPSKIIKKEKNK